MRSIFYSAYANFHFFLTVTFCEDDSEVPRPPTNDYVEDQSLLFLETRFLICYIIGRTKAITLGARASLILIIDELCLSQITLSNAFVSHCSRLQPSYYIHSIILTLACISYASYVGYSSYAMTLLGIIPYPSMIQILKTPLDWTEAVCVLAHHSALFLHKLVAKQLKEDKVSCM